MISQTQLKRLVLKSQYSGLHWNSNGWFTSSPLTKAGMSESRRNKLVTGIVGFILGAIFVVIGLIVYLRNKKGRPSLPVSQTQGLMPHECAT
nr:PREDICTED: HLA class II histocompatibility antigen, DRB1-10 beta chain-like [Latimeria chalumnae]|eukprot:XP_014339641.1 PREDICTED: HLA class II histocompatibility antigen, DRB1-10 beta chain-like [Latimeria chalumnae]